ncbi:MAG: AMP-binding protein [Xanthomonadales bacterium]|jgi:long-subunit acyl-CoA synthetase (AMP-forming)|nr:AMP-binding protein [Xanthomonadales bacterium]
MADADARPVTVSFPERLLAHARQQPTRVALSDPQYAVSYGELPGRIDDLADRLRDSGARRIASRLDNGVPAVLLDFACRRAGLVHLPVPGFFTPAQTAHALADAGIDTLADAASNAPDGIALSRRAVDTVADLPAGTALVTYTSGSTGLPKGVCLSAAHLDTVASSIVEAVAGHTPQRHLAVLPLAVLLESVAGVQAALTAGSEVLLQPLATLGWSGAGGLDPLRFAAAIEQDAPESLILVPELLKGWIHALLQGARAPARLRFCAVGGAHVPPAVLAAAARLGLPVYEGYGLSECASVVCLNRPGHAVPGQVGTPLPHLQLSLSPDGEVLVHGPRFLGYVGHPAPPDGPLSTGDLGEIGADGALTLSGRLGNRYITAYGRNVSPEWSEALLAAHPAIAQAYVHGEALAQAVALLVPRDPALSDTALGTAVDAVNAQLPEYARISAFRRVPPFRAEDGTLTANGRLRRREIHARHADALNDLSA